MKEGERNILLLGGIGILVWYFVQKKPEVPEIPEVPEVPPSDFRDLNLALSSARR